MILNTLTLENIRSFTKQTLAFPKGNTLLSGDVGSGKSTILQAIEFALFGLKRGELNGGSLLRNGKDTGSVALAFTLNDKEVFIKMALKRGTNSISQDFGFLSVNGTGQDYTSTELKQRILELLNYPEETLTKKSMIYRYTVYTPQEDMKLILSGNDEDRMETLRRVFNIDKYKRIRTNARILIGSLREQRKELAGSIYDLETKRQAALEKRQQLSQLQQHQETARKSLEIKRQAALEKRQELSRQEQAASTLVNLKKEHALQEFILTTTREHLKKGTKHINILLEDIHALAKETTNQPTNPLELKRHIELVTSVEQNLKDITTTITSIRVLKHTSETLKKIISRLTTCPTCLQPVQEEHKHLILTNEEEKTRNFEHQLSTLLFQEQTTAHHLSNLRQELEAMREQEKISGIISVKTQELEKKKIALEDLNKEQKHLDQQLEQLTGTVNHLEQEINILKNTEHAYAQARQEHEQALAEEQQAAISYATLTKELTIEALNLEELTKEIQHKEQLKTQLERFTKIQHWIEEHFIILMETLEKTIMSSLHHDFQHHFKKWFNLLIEEQHLHIHLDPTFTPRIEQNGYDLDYESLSGGEKTAAALAYRLALNQAINNLSSAITTKDLLILDEPTDGFSTEQLAKLRDVLQELTMKQIIIVSHEQEIESFVENIIRLEKQDSISKIME